MWLNDICKDIEITAQKFEVMFQHLNDRYIPRGLRSFNVEQDSSIFNLNSGVFQMCKY
jgi:hypothetical protein